MLVTELISLDKRKSKVTLEGGECFALYKGEIRRFHIEQGKELSQENLDEIYEEILKKRVRERSLSLLQSRDYTEYEIRMKLKKGYYPEALIEDGIAFLKKYSYVDDRRYVENYIETYRGKKSMRVLEQSLLKKGIAKDFLQYVMEDMGDVLEEVDETELIRALLEKKHYHAETADYKEKNRVISYLMRKGFQLEDILRCMREDV